MNMCSHLSIYFTIWISLFINVVYIIGRKGTLPENEFPGGVNSVACIMRPRVKNMIASFGRREMRECNGKKERRREIFHYKIWFNFKVPLRDGPGFSRAIPVSLCSRSPAPPKRNNAKITTGARAGIDIVMCLSIKLRELKLCKKEAVYENGWRRCACVIFYYPISRTDLIVSENQFRDAGRIAKNSQYYARAFRASLPSAVYYLRHYIFIGS